MRSKHSTEKRADAMTLKQSIKTLWPYITKFKGRVFIALLALIGTKGATLLMPWALKEIIDSVDKSINPVLVIPALLLLMYGGLRFASVFLGEIRDAVFSRVTEHAMRDIGLKVFKHLHSLELAFHLDRQTGGISRDIERGTSGLSFLMRFLMFNIVPTLFEILTVAIIFGSLFSVWFALITLLAVAIYITFTVTVTQWRNRFIREANTADNLSNTRAIDSLLNFETVKYFNNEEFEAKTYDSFLANWETARLKNRMSLLALNSGQAFIIASAITALMWLGAKEVVTGALTIGELVMINAYMIQLFLPLNFLGFVYREIRRALTDLENMLGLLNKKPQVIERPHAQNLIVTRGDIAFNNVSFSYNANRPILKNISFKIKAGSKVAVVGASGAGKSSLARLLYRFYDVSLGTITIDNQAIDSVTLNSLRSAIAIVPQDTVLFNTSIRENIAYGRPTASDAEIDKAIEMAHLKDFISTLENGDQTRVGERGLKVSGGEKQRIAIARAILKRSPILIFDEATSALDSHAEQAILNAMRAVTQNHTSIVIAHRLSTIIDADNILVFNKGELVEQGTHSALLSKNGQYAQMWHLQQQED